ncbi:MAG: membrane-bound lytic murein transglycosylase B [Paraglaciecola sp.]
MPVMKLLIFTLSFFALLSMHTVYGADKQAHNAEQDFTTKLVQEHGFSADEVRQQLSGASKNDDILKAISRPWEAKPWYQYRPIFLTEKRLFKGLEFWQTHQSVLQRAEQQFGIPAEIIVAIIGVESFYGTYTGSYSALDALYTLGFYYPRRGTFFRKELAELFVLAREEKFSLGELTSSYAGALGWGQFIPSSYRYYAIDFDGDGRRDLLHNPVDAIGSVANYFSRHGWQKNQSVAFPVNVKDSQYHTFLTKGLKYKNTFGQLETTGIQLDQQAAKEFLLPHSEEKWQQVANTADAKLFEFEQPTETEYWLGLKNFYVITRYNHSPLYAMAVYQFSLQLSHARQRQAETIALSTNIEAKP